MIIGLYPGAHCQIQGAEYRVSGNTVWFGKKCPGSRTEPMNLAYIVLCPRYRSWGTDLSPGSQSFICCECMALFGKIIEKHVPAPGELSTVK